MGNGTKRVIAIHDLSGFGRCSLTVVIPILSALGVQVCPVPTAVLSTHTGFGNVCMRDLTDFVTPCLEHFKELSLDFDCVYSGFLASSEQALQVEEYIRAWPDALSCVDPVLGDGGRIYKTITSGLIEKMKELVTKAYMITPNMTEASILLNEEYTNVPIGRDKARSMLVRLSEKGPSLVIITGVSVAPGRISNIGYDKKNNAFWRVDSELIPVNYPGTGDVFSSVLLGSLLTGESLPLAMAKASKFLEIAVSTAYGYNCEPKDGVMIEKSLPFLMKENIVTGYTPL